MSKHERSELDLIDFIRRRPQQLPSSVFCPAGDDGAVFDGRFAARWTVTTDLLVEEVHFRRRWISPRFLGRKTLRVNLSDLAAMGAEPFACLLDLALPRELAGEYFCQFMEGFWEECDRWQVPLVGGDLSRAHSIFAAVTAFGFIRSGEPLYRSHASAGDRLLLVGEIGLSCYALQWLQRQDPEGLERISSEADLERWSGGGHLYQALRAHLLPDVPAGVGPWLQKNGYAHSMIDVSDGLARDLLHLLKESSVAAELDRDQVSGLCPLPEEERNLALVLEGGEDYALLFSCSEEQFHRLAGNYPAEFPPYRLIGRLVEGPPAIYLRDNGSREEYTPGGFDHFR